jgi:hypothetical protein
MSHPLRSGCDQRVEPGRPRSRSVSRNRRRKSCGAGSRNRCQPSVRLTRGCEPGRLDLNQRPPAPEAITRVLEVRHHLALRKGRQLRHVRLVKLLSARRRFRDRAPLPPFPASDVCRCRVQTRTQTRTRTRNWTRADRWREAMRNDTGTFGRGQTESLAPYGTNSCAPDTHRDGSSPAVRHELSVIRFP